MNDDASKPPASPAAERAAALLRALRKHRQRLERTLVAIRGDLAEAERAPEFRRAGETLLAYLGQVPIRATSVALPDPADPERRIEIALDPALKPQANAARYFKRAAKAERGLEEIPVRSRAVEAERERALEHATRLEAELAKEGEWNAARERRLGRLTDDGLLLLPPVLRREVPALRPATESIVDDAGTQEIVHRPAPRKPVVVPARLNPRRLRTEEGWDVLIGRSNEGNDHLTHHLARPEDYWFHVHGCPGSHVVLRRGKGKNEPSKRTLEEVASWAAFYSQARTAGKVPVIWTLKKYVRRPRKGPAGLALCEREKSLMVRPVEPPRSALADSAEADAEA